MTEPELHESKIVVRRHPAGRGLTKWVWLVSGVVLLSEVL